MRLNLGCGEKKREGYVNIDMDPVFKPDVCMDLTLDWEFEDNSVDFIYGNMLVEHISDLNHFFGEIARVLRPQGTFELVTANNFFWRNRINYLLGKPFIDNSFHMHHCWLIKPSHLRTVAMQHNFKINLEGHGLLPFPDLFYKRIVLKGRLRQ